MFYLDKSTILKTDCYIKDLKNNTSVLYQGKLGSPGSVHVYRRNRKYESLYTNATQDCLIPEGLV